MLYRRAVTGDEIKNAAGAEVIINAASGTWYADYDYVELLSPSGGTTKMSFNASVVGVAIRNTTLAAAGGAGAGTVDTIRVKIASKRHCRNCVTAATVPAESLVYDSGSIATPTASATAAADTVTPFDPSPYSGGFRILVDWTASGGTYDRVVKIGVMIAGDQKS